MANIDHPGAGGETRAQSIQAQPSSPRRAPADRPLELAVIVPTFQEAANVAPLVESLRSALADIAWEVIFVDDHSPDETAAAVREIGLADRRVRCIERLGRRGLASACIEGAMATSAPVMAVIDADLQHDEKLLPDMLEALRGQGLDVVIGSRYAAGGGVGAWAADRVWKSQIATRLANRVLGAELTDPLSGFFMMPTALFREIAPRLSGVGFKILLDIFLSARRRLAFRELAYVFRPRQAGESKLDTVVALELLILLYEKTLGRIVPVRFAMFSLIGGLGVFVHMGALTALHLGLGRPFVTAQAGATVLAMTFNFFLNNALTYRDARLKGARRLFLGWLSFCLVCGGGALANVGVAAFLHEAQSAHWTVSALAGVAIGAVWNYVLSSRFTWGRY